MKILVAGRHGQIAQSLIERVVAFPQFELTAMGRPQADLKRPQALRRLIENLRPALIINAAAYTAVDMAENDPTAFLVNRDGARSLAEAASAVEARLIHLSTDYVFDGSGDVPRDENASTGPINAYGRSKLEGEEAVRAVFFETTIVRTAWVYSPFGTNFVRTMMNAAKTGNCLSVVADQFGSPTSALDVADGLLALAGHISAGSNIGRGETYHLAGSPSASWAQFAQAIMAECAAIGEPSAKIDPIPSELWPTPATRPRNSRLDSNKFARDVGYIMPQWPRSLAAVVHRIAEER